MNRMIALFAAGVVLIALSGCTVFQDDVYKLQAGYYGSSSFDAVEAAIHDEFADRFGEENVFRADIEWKYNHWTVVSQQMAFGLDKHRTRIYAYPQLDQDGMYEPVVVVRNEVYTGGSYGFGRGGPTAMYSGKWSEAGRDVDLETELANGIYNRLHSNGSGEAGGK